MASGESERSQSRHRRVVWGDDDGEARSAVGVSIHNEVIIAVNNSDHLNGEATKQCYRMGVFYKKEKKENVDDQTAMTTRKMRNEK